MKKNPWGFTNDSRGNFKKVIGRRGVDGDNVPTTFYLGRDRAAACFNALNLEKVWNVVHDRWYRLKETEVALWDDTTYEIGKAVALGKPTVAVAYPYPIRADEAFLTEFKLWLVELRARFPMIQIEPANAELDALANEMLELEAQEQHSLGKAYAAMGKAETAKAKINELLVGKVVESGFTLGMALTGFGDFLAKKHVRENGLVTERGKGMLTLIGSLRHNLGTKVNTSLSKVGNAFIEEWVLHWAARPMSKRYKRPVSVEWAKDAIKTIRAFVRWLNRRSADYGGWHTPPDYEVMPVRIRKTHEEIAGKTKGRVRYKREEVGVLWEYAAPLERVYILLALNCGFGCREIETLLIEDVNLDKGEIARVRTKTAVFCKWNLWPETVAALRWYLEKVRPEAESKLVFVTQKGRPIVTATVGNNRSQTIPNAWARVYDRITKDKPDFIRLSFNKCRKTGSNWIRHHYGKELADLYLSHGKQEVVDAYTDRRFRPMNKAVAAYGRVLRPLFAVVADPFPDRPQKEKMFVSLGTAKRIRELRAQGFTVRKISSELGVSTQTVMRHSAPAKAPSA